MLGTPARHTACITNGKQEAVGPISAEELLALRDQGILQRETLVLPPQHRMAACRSLDFLFAAKTPRPKRA